MSGFNDVDDHVLVRAHIDSQAYWLDGTLPPVAVPSARPVFPIGWALPLTAKGSGIKKLAWQPATTPNEINVFEIDARAGLPRRWPLALPIALWQIADIVKLVEEAEAAPVTRGRTKKVGQILN